MPILEIDGKTLSGSTPISRYVAMTSGLYPTAPKDVYQHELICDLINSIYDAIIVPMVRHQDEKVEEYWTKSMATVLKQIESRL
jgi:glutathione S-transferase